MSVSRREVQNKNRC